MKANITARMPEKSEDTTLVQAKIPSALFQIVEKYKLKKHLSWNEILTACFESLRDELEKQK